MFGIIGFKHPDGVTPAFSLEHGGTIFIDGVERKILFDSSASFEMDGTVWNTTDFAVAMAQKGCIVTAGDGILRLAPSEAIRYMDRGANPQITLFGIEGEFVRAKILRSSLPLGAYYYELQVEAQGKSLWVTKDTYGQFSGSVVLKQPITELYDRWKIEVPSGALHFFEKIA